jgi:hypothetical protein
MSVTHGGIEMAAGEILRFGRQVKFDPNRWMKRAETPEARREPASAEGWQCGKGQPSLVDVARSGEARPKGGERVYRFTGDDCAGFRQLNTLCVATEQRDAQLRFELTNVIADRRG